MKTQKNLLILCTLLCNFIFAQQNDVSYCNIMFGENSDQFSKEYSVKLDSLVRIINPGEEIGLTGYSDSDGDERINKSVSKRRAVSIKNYFRAKGISNKIHLEFKGEDFAMNLNATESEKAFDRRVEIIHDYAKYNDAFNSFKKDYQVYIINPNSDTILNCAEGLTLKFPAKVFNTKSTEPITIKVQEFYSKSDFILAGLNTQGSGNTLLESGGMMNIEAWQFGKKLDIRNGQVAGILFKNRQLNDSMQLFNGEQNNTGSISWLQSVSDQSFQTVEHSIKTKEIMRVSYSVPDTGYIYSHYWEEGPLKITKSTVKGMTTFDTLDNETIRSAVMMLGTAKLGWINCDRFVNSNIPQTVVEVNYKNSMIPFISIVFKDINSIMASNGDRQKNILFKGVPENKSITVIGIFKRKDSDKVFFAMQPAVSGRDKSIKLNFEELSPEEVKERLKDL